MQSRTTARRCTAALTFCAALTTSGLLSACGGAGSKSEQAPVPGSGAGAVESVTIGIDPTTMPYASKEGGKLIGMDPDVARSVAKQANVDAKLVELTFDNAVPALKSGRAQVSFVGGWFDNDERRAEMNIISYYQAPVGFVTQAGGPTVGETAEGRCGLTLATYASSPSYLKVLQEDSAKCEKSGQKPITIQTFAGLAQGVLAVRSGRIAGFLDAVPAVAYQAHVGSGLKFVTVTDQPNTIWGIAVSKSDAALAEKLAKAVDAVRQSGELGKIWERFGLPESMNLDRITLNGNPV